MREPMLCESRTNFRIPRVCNHAPATAIRSTASSNTAGVYASAPASEACTGIWIDSVV